MEATILKRLCFLGVISLSVLDSVRALARGPSAGFGAALAVNEACEGDVAFALDELHKQCGELIASKGIDWGKVRVEFEKEARAVKDDGAHMALLIRLLARLRDGHAEVLRLDAGKDVVLPEDWLVERRGPGFFLCRSGKHFYVKTAWGEARGLGIEPGTEVVKIDGVATAKWIDARVEELRDRISFSTEQQAFFHATHWGLAHEVNTRLKLDLVEPDGKKRKRTVACVEKSSTPDGPAFAVPGLRGAGDSIRYATLPGGEGYVHVRRVKADVIDELDRALDALGDVPGLILDFRGNSGGGCDHDAFEARFVPLGRELPRKARAPLAGAGAKPYGGPLVVIVDATARSSGETLAGMFAEDGRGLSIGESATAGMSSQKATIELPSRLFALYVSVGTNRSSFNDGRGIEGLGVSPQEQLEYDPDDLAAGVDTMIRRACERLADFPRAKVAYDPKDYGWGG